MGGCRAGSLPRLLALLAAALLVPGCVSQPPREPAGSAAPAVETGAGQAEWSPAAVAGKGFTIGPDARVFALFALLDWAGVLEKESGPAPDPVRLRLRGEVREALKLVEPVQAARWKDFAAGFPGGIPALATSAMSLGVPPRFGAGSPADRPFDPRGSASGQELGAVLAGFWKQAGLQIPYTTFYREEIARRAMAWDPGRIAFQLDEVHRYLRLPASLVEGFRLAIVPNPLDIRGTRRTVATVRTLYMLEGPGIDEREIPLREYLRCLVDPAVAGSAGARSPVVKAIVAGQASRPLVKGVREEPRLFVGECLARAIAARVEISHSGGGQAGLLDSLWQRMRKEADDGLVLVPLFFAELARFEMDEGMSLAQFVESVLASLGKSSHERETRELPFDLVSFRGRASARFTDDHGRSTSSAACWAAFSGSGS
jgi:hypothetical protein